MAEAAPATLAQGSSGIAIGTATGTLPRRMDRAKDESLILGTHTAVGTGVWSSIEPLHPAGGEAAAAGAVAASAAWPTPPSGVGCGAISGCAGAGAGVPPVDGSRFPAV